MKRRVGATGRGGGRLDVVLIAALAILVRLPFLAGTLWAWDSILYARAMTGFDPQAGIPQPPSYLFYVLLGRAAAGLLGDANAGLVALSVAGGAGMAVAGYLGARALAGRGAGLLAAALLLVEPLAWHQSEVAYPYALLGALAGAFAVAAIGRPRIGPRGWIALSLAAGLAAGVRQDLVAISGPLWLVATLRYPRSVVVPAVAAAAAGALAWFVPTAIAAGGAPHYLDLVWGQATGSSGMMKDASSALDRNVQVFLTGLGWQLFWLWPFAAIGAVVVARRTGWIRVWLALATLPAVGLYLFLHTGEPAYTLSLAVVAAILCATGITATLARLAVAPRTGLALRAAAVASLAAPFALGTGPYTADAISRHDALVRAQVAYVRDHLSPADTILVGKVNYQHALYYLPEFSALKIHGHGRLAADRLADAVAPYRTVVFLDESWTGIAPRAVAVPLGQGLDLRVTDGARFASTLRSAADANPDVDLDLARP